MSSAYDMARLITLAASDDRIASVMRSPYYTFRTRRGPLTVHSTNQLVMKGDVDVRGGEDWLHRQSGLLSRDAAPPAPIGSRSRLSSWEPGRCRPLHGNAAPVQLALEQGA